MLLKLNVFLENVKASFILILIKMDTAGKVYLVFFGIPSLRRQ